MNPAPSPINSVNMITGYENKNILKNLSKEDKICEYHGEIVTIKDSDGKDEEVLSCIANQ